MQNGSAQIIKTVGENSASSDATVREKIAKLPPAVSEQAKLSSITCSQEAEVLGVQVEEASHLLDNYNLRLQEELKDRKKVDFLNHSQSMTSLMQVGTMIAEFLSAQKDLLAQAEERLEQYQDKMDRQDLEKAPFWMDNFHDGFFAGIKV